MDETATSCGLKVSQTRERRSARSDAVQGTVEFITIENEGSGMPTTETCPQCDGTDVWMEERPRGFEFGCHHCNYRWNTDSGTAT